MNHSFRWTAFPLPQSELMRSIYIHGIFFMAFFASFTVKGQGYLSTMGKEIVTESGEPILLRGMGLGGWMLQEGYMLQTASFANPQYQIRGKIEELIGSEATEEFYAAWLANHCRKIDIDSLKSWGFNSVRLPMDFALFTLPIEDEPIEGQHTWLETGFTLTDSLIAWCAANEMYVVLDLHAAPGGQGYDQGISNYDPSKPSLWESQANKDKTVALWKRLAERYVDEPWVAGYDLINEPNWDLPGGVALRNLYGEITDSIRAVDDKHIIFIEGNWFANDFTGLTPPWDDNMVYSPHKYWSINDQGSIQWVLNLRNQYNIPLYLGESGENSNVWFRDAIRLLEDNNIGWAWWPMKKIESISGPLSVVKSPEYQTLLNFWENGGNRPSVSFATNTLMQVTEDLKLENCIYQKDVIDAMFRQVYSDETVPFRVQEIPGVVYATDFDMGVVGEAYHDIETANYQVSTGRFTSWNNGWSYRNDGVDLEVCQDDVNTNGYNVGWIDDGEWMQYSVAVAEDAAYEVNIRYASNVNGASIHLNMDGADLNLPFFISSTGGWQTWRTLTIPNLILKTTDKKLRFYANKGGVNINSFEFVKRGESAAVLTQFVAAETTDESTIKLNINKAFDNATLPSTFEDWQLFINGTAYPVVDLEVAPQNERIIYLSVDQIMRAGETIKVSYSGNQISAKDGTSLEVFFRKDVQNNIPTYYLIPGKIESEDFYFQSGVLLENTTDNGGGQNIGTLDPNDYLDYYVEIPQSGIYAVDYRVASQQSGEFELQLVNEDGNITSLHSGSVSSTGGWQNWETITLNAQIPAGRYTLRFLITRGPFNVNWMEFRVIATSIANQSNTFENIQIFPNPVKNELFLDVRLNEALDIQVDVISWLGQVVFQKQYFKLHELRDNIDLKDLPQGGYILRVQASNGSVYTEKIIKGSP